MRHQADQETLDQEIQEVLKPLLEWRRLRGAPRPIPEGIWEKATRLAAVYGVGVIASRLGLERTKLRRKVAAMLPVRKKTIAKVPCRELQPVEAKFVELFESASMSVSTTSVTNCVLLIDSSRGSRLRVRIDGLKIPDLALLLKEFG